MSKRQRRIQLTGVVVPNDLPEYHFSCESIMVKDIAQTVQDIVQNNSDSDLFTFTVKRLPR